MQVHKILNKKLKDNELISPIDHLIACNSHGFTDLRFTKLDIRITPESKYYLAMNIDNKPTILCHPNLYNLRQEIDEKMIKGNYFNGYDAKNNRVFLHYKGDGKFRIGNKNGIDEFITSFEMCDLNKLAKRHNYKAFINFLENKHKHRGIQVLLCELGVSLGYYVKIANNDLSSIQKLDYANISPEKILSITDMNLSHIMEKNIINNIDRIDVIWYDPLTKRIVSAFEVERSRNYDSVLRRFSSIVPSTPYNPYLICVGEDYNGFQCATNNEPFKTWLKNVNLNYLPLDSLYTILNDHKKYNLSLNTESLLKSNLIKLNNTLII